MGRPAIDLAGYTFDRLTVIERIPSPTWEPKNVWWLCRCLCGQTTRVRTSHLRAGTTRSCGCLTVEAVKRANTKHGQYKSREYGAWAQMIYRCENPHAKNARHYSQRGITVDPRWRDFPTFLADMGPCPDGHSLERLDNTAGYTPANCCWADIFQQNRNRRNSNFIEWNGKRLTVSEWARDLGITRNTVKNRWKRHQSLADRIRRYRTAYPATRQPNS